jgi:hypothetical protein
MPAHTLHFKHFGEAQQEQQKKKKKTENLQKLASFNPIVVTGNYAVRKVSY